MSTGRAPTQRDVASLAGVSMATVSYILSGRRDRATPVTPRTRERVLAAVAELGYRRNQVARSLRRQRTELVCLVYRMPDNPWLERLVDQLQEVAEEHGYSVVVLPVRGEELAEPALRVLRERTVDGAIIAPGTRMPAGELGRLAAAGLALAVFDDDLRPDGFDVVDQAQDAAIRALVRHLVDAGHRRIAYLGHEPDLTAAAGTTTPAGAVFASGTAGGDRSGAPADPLASKCRSVVAALAECGLPLDPGLTVAGADSRAGAYTATRRLLAATEPPTALLSASDRGAVAAIAAARELGVPVPGGLAVAGMGNAPEGAAITPALTTVGIDRLDFGPVVGRLFERIEAPEPPDGTRLELPWQLIVRDSTVH